MTMFASRKLGRHWFVAALIFAVGRILQADTLPRGRPEELGFSSQRLDQIDRFYEDKVKAGQMAGLVLLIARHGKIAHFSAVGYANVETKQKMQTDAIFRLYSMTKPIAATALMLLYQEGRFQLGDPVAKYLPEFANLKVLRNPDGALDDTVPLDRPPTIQDLMRHTAGFTHGGPPDPYNDQYDQKDVFGVDVSLAEMMQRLASMPLRYQPGTKWCYSVGPDVEARLVEVLSGMPFDKFLQQRLFGPLGMSDSGFWVQPDKATRLVSVSWMKDGMLVPLDDTHGHPDCGVLCQTWSANSYTVDHKRKGGSFGLVATAQDYWRFAQMVANGGTLDGTRILYPQVARYMVRDHLGVLDVGWGDGRPTGLGWGLGFAVLRDPSAAGFMGSEGTFFWHGAAGTTFWVDPKQDMVVVAMVQHLNVPTMAMFWPEIRTLVYGALLQ
jgi:CubicO group peptidase (beta-lactamase class C family)